MITTERRDEILALVAQLPEAERVRAAVAMVKLHYTCGRAFYLVAGTFNIESYGADGLATGNEHLAYSSVWLPGSGWADDVMETNDYILERLREAGVAIL